VPHIPLAVLEGLLLNYREGKGKWKWKKEGGNPTLTTANAATSKSFFWLRQWRKRNLWSAHRTLNTAMTTPTVLSPTAAQLVLLFSVLSILAVFRLNATVIILV